MAEKQPTTLSGTHIGIEDDKRTSVEARHDIAKPQPDQAKAPKEPEQTEQEKPDAPPAKDQIESD